MHNPRRDLQRGKRQPAEGIGRQHQQGANQRAAAQQRYLAAAQHERAICGAIRPTKPRLPTQETLAEVSSTGAKRSTVSRCRRTPRPMAVRSPSSATSAARAVQNRMMAPGSAQQKATASSGQVAACRLPASQIDRRLHVAYVGGGHKDADRGRQVSGDADAN